MFPLVAILPVAVETSIVLLMHAAPTGFATGMGLGAGLAAALVMFDSPPAHIERWRAGAEGEKSTARTLRPLLRQGWVLFNDIDTGHGNIDHVLVGPAGVFLLESKRLAGQLRVDAGTLIVRWHEDPDDGYENGSVAARARGAAFALHSRLEQTDSRAWVQAVVVLWSDFPQRSVEQERVTWVRGDALADVLANRPVKYSGDALADLIARTGEAVSTIRSASRASRSDADPRQLRRAAQSAAADS